MGVINYLYENFNNTGISDIYYTYADGDCSSGFEKLILN